MPTVKGYGDNSQQSKGKKVLNGINPYSPALLHAGTPAKMGDRVFLMISYT